MGIRFHCPNGHKLHVKDFLAGKKGICPKCGVKVDIPGESGRQVVGDATVPVNQPVAGASETVQSAHAMETATAKSTQSAVTQIPTAGPAAPNLNATWYVRIPTGQQFGPATESDFREWIRQGRVGPDCVVWREGWADWRTWPSVQGEFFPPQPPPAPQPEPTVVPPSVVPPIVTDSTAANAETNPVAGTAGKAAVQIETDRPMPKRRSHKVVYLLLAICVCLLPILIFVLTRN